MATPVYSSKEPPQYTQHDNGTDIQQQNFEHEQLPAYTHGPNAPRSSTTPISTSASSISDQESDIVLNFLKTDQSKMNAKYVVKIYFVVDVLDVVLALRICQIVIAI